MDLINITLKTIFFYFFIILAYRIMGKREIGQLGIIDLIVSILIAELVAISIENFNDSVLNTIIPVLVLVILEVGLAYVAIKSKKIRYFFDGKPSLIINEGKINYKEMVKLRYSIDDLLFQLRQQQVKSIEEVEYAILEPNGKLSIFPYNKLKFKTSYPMALIMDGELNKEVLKKNKKNKKWLDEVLFNNHLTLNDIFYAFLNKNKLFIIKKSNLK